MNRRDFLRTLSLAASAMFIPMQAAQDEYMEEFGDWMPIESYNPELKKIVTMPIEKAIAWMESRMQAVAANLPKGAYLLSPRILYEMRESSDVVRYAYIAIKAKAYAPPDVCARWKKLTREQKEDMVFVESAESIRQSNEQWRALAGPDYASLGIE